MKSLEDLKKLRDQIREDIKIREKGERVKITIGMGTTGIASGAREVLKTIINELEIRNFSDVEILQTGSIGLDAKEPLLTIEKPGLPKVTYGLVTVEMAKRIVVEHVINGQIIGDWVVRSS
ncbi:MAG: NADP-reducing hydrogenase subunit HndB [candidate division WS2 bacterium]|nr:NADP-reducing hydrogenase subunit HndB [Candidatus Lithacetigena glycinireducens]